MVSHVDFLPTLAGLFDPPSPPAPTGRESITPRSPPPQDYVVFTYDDYQSGQASGPYPQPPNHIVSIREERYKLAKYYDADHPDAGPVDWETRRIRSKSRTSPGPITAARPRRKRSSSASRSNSQR